MCMGGVVITPFPPIFFKPLTSQAPDFPNLSKISVYFKFFARARINKSQHIYILAGLPGGARDRFYIENAPKRPQGWAGPKTDCYRN